MDLLLLDVLGSFNEQSDVAKKMNNWAISWDYVLFALHKLILQAPMPSHPVGLDGWFFGQTLRLFPYFMCVNRGGSGETVRICRLAWAFAGHLCDKN